MGIPADQLAAFDHRLSSPALLKVDTATSFTEIFPVSLINAWLPDIVIWASWSAVIPSASVPKETSSSTAPVITSDPVPQSADELSTKAADVTSAANTRFKVPTLPIVIVPIADWFLFIVNVVVNESAVLIFPFNVFAPLIIILAPAPWTSIWFPETSKVPSSETFEVIKLSLFVPVPATIISPVCEDPS